MIFRFEPDPQETGPDFAELAARIEQYLDERAVPGAVLSQLMIALDEVISNVLNYNAAGEGASGAPPLELAVSVEVEKRRVIAEVADNGAAFDPLSLPEPDTRAGVDERDYGGLGVHIVRKLMDEVAYAREGGWNRLRFSKTFELG